MTPMERYDPELAPDPREWLALGENGRLTLVETYHRDARISLARHTRALHATMHVDTATEGYYAALRKLNVESWRDG